MGFFRKRIATALLLATVFFVPSLAGAQFLTGYHDDAPSAPALVPAPVLHPPVTEPAPQSTDVKNNAPVDLTADSLQHDETGQTITATGHVELVQAGRVLKADEIVYNLGTDTVKARGNIALLEKNGDIHFADEVELNNEMKTGFVSGLNSYLSAGGHFTAKSGKREENTIVMSDASYTPCDCDADKEGDPAWQIKADKVTYHEAENRIAYKNATFEIFGIPVGWLPFVSHPDGKVKRKSGFLSPQLGFDSELGAVVTSNYYWALAPDRDLTTGVMAMTEKAPVGLAEYRQRFDNADLHMNGSVTNSGRTDSVAGVDVEKGDSWRGHLFADGKWDVNDKWRAGTSLELTSDDQYLRQYDFSGKDVLENEIFAERFSGRNYAVGRVLAFQDVRVGERRTDQPNVLPEVVANFKGEPNGFLGGRWALDLSVLGLERGGNGQDMNRGVAALGWEKRVITDFGLVNTLDVSFRGDAYSARDRDIATQGLGRSKQGTETRVFPQAHLVTSYPIAKPMETMQAVIEPIVAITVSPHVNVEDSDIPNEDSQDVQLDASNLFEPNRFPGLDRLEDGTHVTYGARTGLYGYGGSFADVFLGQSHRFDENDNPFPNGSGLATQDSDVVGQVAMGIDGNYTLNYRFQLDAQDLTPRRHELDVYAHWRRFTYGARYLFANALEGTDIVESREQIQNAVAYDITSKWRLRGAMLHDLGEDPGLRKAAVGLDYLGCCLSFSANAERSLTTDSSGDSGTDITLRLGLKGLGEFDQGGTNERVVDRPFGR
ncbi:MAG TPA: LPS assembly protein LptD [Alphaproteobacteria bacterium]|jgi:LPS-assembly protein